MFYIYICQSMNAEFIEPNFIGLERPTFKWLHLSFFFLMNITRTNFWAFYYLQRRYQQNTAKNIFLRKLLVILIFRDIIVFHLQIHDITLHCLISERFSKTITLIGSEGNFDTWMYKNQEMRKMAKPSTKICLTEK